MKTKRVDYSDVPENLNDHPFFGFKLDEEQKILRDEIYNPDRKIIFVNAKAGTGKTFVSVVTSVLMHKYGLYDGILYIVNACQESKQGYLKGDLAEKSAVYFDALSQALVKCNELPDRVIKSSSPAEEDKEGLAYVTAITSTFLRGINIENKVVIIDEAQNYDVGDLKKTLTRIHDNSKVIVIGHEGQIDLPDASRSGFARYVQWFLSKNDDRAIECKLTTSHRGWIANTADDLVE